MILAQSLSFVALASALAAPNSASPKLVPSVYDLMLQESLSAVGQVEEVSATGESTDTAPSDTTTAPKTNLIQAKRVAVYALELQGIDPNIGAVVTDSLLAEVRKLQGISAIGMDEIRDMLSHEANKQILGCEADDSCLAEIAGALGVDDLVTGKLSKVGDGHVLLVRRIDQNRAQVVGSVSKRLKAGSGQEFLLAVGPAVEELFADRPLRAGMERGVPKEVALRLDPPPLPTWTFWAVAGGAVAAAVTGGILGGFAKSKEGEYQREAASGVPSASQPNASVNGSDLNAIGSSAEGFATGANVAFGTAGAMALAAGIMYLFTDWEGYGEAEVK